MPSPDTHRAVPRMTAEHPIVGGRSRPGQTRIDVFSPCDGEKVAEVSLATPADIDEAVALASSRWRYWHGLAWSKKRDILERVQYLLVDRAEGLARIIALEQGKPVHEALAVEVIPSADHARFLATAAERLLRARGRAARQPLFLHKKAHLRAEPFGAVLIISPWNYPFAIPFIQAMTALAAGNSVVIKPSPDTPLSALALGRILLDAGIPEPIVHVLPVPTEGAEQLVGHPDIRKVVFTGSTATGRRIQELASRNTTPVLLELGGKDAAIVLRDADLERTARGLCWAAFLNAGQTCASIERVYVEAEIAGPLIERCTELAAQLKVGDPFVDQTEMGPLTRETERRRVIEQIDDAVRGGAVVHTGGRAPERKGWYYAPTVLSGARDGMRILEAETFGPVLAFAVVDSADEALARCNASPFGLCASVWTSSRGSADTLAAALEVGTVTINDAVFSFGESTACWGGQKQSGYGRTHGPEGLYEMIQWKYVSLDPAGDAGPVWWYPYDKSYLEFVHNALPALYAPSLSRRLAGLARLLRIKRFRDSLHPGALIRNLRKMF